MLVSVLLGHITSVDTDLIFNENAVPVFQKAVRSSGSATIYLY